MRTSGAMTILAALVGLGIGLGGCQSSTGGTVDHRGDAPGVSKSEPSKAETAKAEPAKAEPAKSEPSRASGTGRSSGYRPNAPAGSEVTSLAFPTGDVNSSALLVHQVMPGQVRVGQPYAYEIHVTNLTGGTLQNVLVSAESASNMNMTSSTPAATRAADGSMVWSLGSLGPNETQVIKVNASAPSVGTSSQCVSVSYNNALCIQTKVVEPALQLVKTITPEALLCDAIVIKYEVKNPGTGLAENVRVRDTLPAGLTTADGKTAIDLDAGTLSPGQSKTLTVNAKATKTGRFESPASAVAAGNLTANAAAVATVVRQPVLTIASKCSERQFLGRDVTFEWTVKNTGDAPAANTVVSSPLPSGAQFVRAAAGGTASGANVTWNLGILAPNESKTVSFTVKPSAMGTLAASASANAACATAVNTQCQTRLEGIPAILLEVVDVEDPIEVGGDVTYIITVTNQGTATGTGIKISAELPEQQGFVSAGGATSGTASGRSVTFAPLASLAPKAKAEFRVVVKANGEGDVRFRVNMTTDQQKEPVTETESTNLYR